MAVFVPENGRTLNSNQPADVEQIMSELLRRLSAADRPPPPRVTLAPPAATAKCAAADTSTRPIDAPTSLGHRLTSSVTRRRATAGIPARRETNLTLSACDSFGRPFRDHRAPSSPPHRVIHRSLLARARARAVPALTRIFSLSADVFFSLSVVNLPGASSDVRRRRCPSASDECLPSNTN